MTDASEFKRASHEVWEAMAPGWDERHAQLEAAPRPVTERLLERLAPADGATILELAAGNGIVGLAAAAFVGRSGRVIVSDFSEAMVEAAKRRAEKLGLENVECRTLDAERLDLADDSVDGVVCRWGYMLMGDPAAALAETRRVLRRDGRLSAAVFAGPEQNPWVTVPSRVLQKRGHMPPPEAGAPGILALADPERLRQLFAGADFTEPQIDDVPFTWKFRDLDDYWEFLTGAAGAVALILGRLDEDERADIRGEIDDNMAPFVGADGIELPAVSLVASAS